MRKRRTDLTLTPIRERNALVGALGSSSDADLPAHVTDEDTPGEEQACCCDVPNSSLGMARQLAKLHEVSVTMSVGNDELVKEMKHSSRVKLERMMGTSNRKDRKLQAYHAPNADRLDLARWRRYLRDAKQRWRSCRPLLRRPLGMQLSCTQSESEE